MKTTLDVDTREIVGVHIGDRSETGARQLWESLPPVYRHLGDDKQAVMLVQQTLCVSKTLFGVFKTRGFCLESTHFKDMERLSELLAMVWALKSGLLLHQQKPIPVKKHGYQAKSFFRHGFDFLRRIFSNLSLLPQEFNLAIQFLS